MSALAVCGELILEGLNGTLEPADIGRIIATAGEAEPRLTRLLATVVERLA